MTFLASPSDKSDPVRNTRDTADLRRAMRQACAARGLSSEGARLIHRYSNAVYLLPAEPAVARVSTAAAARAHLVHAATKWLANTASAPATTPVRDAPPVTIDPFTTVSFWTYYPQPDSIGSPTSAHLARALKPLHSIDTVPIALERWQPLQSLSTALDDSAVARNLARPDADWLRTRVAELQAEVEALDSPLGHGIIHGDAWAGNLLWHTAAGPDSVVLGDWDWISIGPREVDLIPTWHAAIRYGRGSQWAHDFADAYGYDLAPWDGFPILFAMRDLVQLTGPLKRAGDRPEFAAALRQRLDGVRHHDTHAIWQAL